MHVHYIPLEDIAVNHRQRNCPCIPEVFYNHRIGEHVVTLHKHRNKDGADMIHALEEMCGVKQNDDLIRFRIVTNKKRT